MNAKKKVVICLQCPKACAVEVIFDEAGSISEVRNNQCNRGESYARGEIINPARMLTTTIQIDSKDEEHPLLPVQTNKPIKKELLFDCMNELSKVQVKPPVKYFDIIVKDILGSGVDIVSSSEVIL